MRVTNVVPWVQLRYSVFFSIPVCRYPMVTRALVTVSPSRSRISRRTPCVDGCRPHVDDEALLAVRVGEGEVPAPAGDRVDAALGGLAGAGVRIGRVVGGA